MNLLANALLGHVTRREHLRRVQNEQQQERDPEAARAGRPSARSGAVPPKRASPPDDSDTAQRQQPPAPDYDEAVTLLQSALQGHSKRQKFLWQQSRGSRARAPEQ